MLYSVGRVYYIAGQTVSELIETNTEIFNGQPIEYIRFRKFFVYSFNSSLRDKLWGIIKSIVNILFQSEEKATKKVTMMPEAEAVHLRQHHKKRITYSYSSTWWLRIVINRTEGDFSVKIRKLHECQEEKPRKSE